MKPFTLLLSLFLLAATISQAHAYWAAVVGTTGNVIYAESYPSKDSAASSALHRCETMGLQSCKVVGSGISNCFAAASTGAASPHWGFGIDAGRLNAAGKALAACKSLKAGQCHVAYMSFCR